MDILRGLAIILVIFNHALLFTTDIGFEPPRPLEVLNIIFAPVRMPLMVFLSGLLIPRSLAKGLRGYWTGKFQVVLYAYLLWAVLWVGKGLFGPVMAGGANWGLLLEIFYSPPAHTWFLAYLLIFYIIAFATKAIPPLFIAGVALIAGFFFDANAERFTLLLAFFMIGIWTASIYGSWLRILADKRVLVASALVSMGFVVAAMMGLNLRYETYAAPAVCAAIIISAAFARRFGMNNRGGRALSYVGQRSLIFYLFHFYVTSVGVTLVSRISENSIWMVAGGFSFGFAISLFVALVTDRFPKALWLFEAFPQSRTRT